MLEDNDSWIADALVVLADGAGPSSPLKAVNDAHRKRARPRKTPEAEFGPQPINAALLASPSSVRDHNGTAAHIRGVADGNPTLATELLSQTDEEVSPATDPVRDPSDHEDQMPRVADGTSRTVAADDPLYAVYASIAENHRRRWDMIRARQRLELQGMSVCRHKSGGDKVEGAKLWAEVLKDETHPERLWLQPYIAASAPLREAQAEIEKTLVRAVKRLPFYDWAKGIRGLGDVSLSAILGETTLQNEDGSLTTIAGFKSVSAVWKRLGLAVIGTERQRKKTGGEAELHGYNPQRRSILWNIGQGLIKAQVRKDPDDDEKRIGIGEFGALYLERKAFEATKPEVESKGHAHNRAQRYVEKRLIRHLYAVARQ